MFRTIREVFTKKHDPRNNACTQMSGGCQKEFRESTRARLLRKFKEAVLTKPTPKPPHVKKGPSLL
jgi:hypothetical protein